MCPFLSVASSCMCTVLGGQSCNVLGCPPGRYNFYQVVTETASPKAALSFAFTASAAGQLQAGGKITLTSDTAIYSASYGEVRSGSAAACPPGYTKAGDGYWSTGRSSQGTYGVADCAQICTSSSTCVAFSVFEPLEKGAGARGTAQHCYVYTATTGTANADTTDALSCTKGGAWPHAMLRHPTPAANPIPLPRASRPCCCCYVLLAGGPGRLVPLPFLQTYSVPTRGPVSVCPVP